MFDFRIAFLTLLALVAVALPIGTMAQDSRASSISREIVEAKIGETENAANMPEDSRLALLESYRQTLAYLDTSKANNSLAEKYVDIRNTGSERLNQLQQQTERLKADESPASLTISDQASTQDIESQLQKEQANQAAIRTKNNGIQQAIDSEKSRPQQVREALVDASNRLDEVAEELRDIPSASDDVAGTQASRWRMLAKSAAIGSEITAFDEELLSQPYRLELLRAEKIIGKLNLTKTDALIGLLNQQLLEQRRSDTADVIASVNQLPEGLPRNEVIRRYSDYNSELSTELSDTTSALEVAQAEVARTKIQLKKVRASFQVAQQRMDIAGMNKALGRAMHEQRRDLPELRLLKRAAEKREDKIINAGLLDIQINSELDDYANTASRAVDLLSDTDARAPEEQIQALVGTLDNTELLLKNLKSTNRDYLRTLAELEFQQQQLIQQVEEIDEYLGERLLWVRSQEPLFSDKSYQAAVKEMKAESITDDILLAAGSTLLREAFGSPPLIITFVLVLGILGTRRKLLGLLKATAQYINSPATDSIKYTFQALGISLLLASVWPMVSLALGYTLFEYGESMEARAIGEAFILISNILLFIRFVYVICLDGGLAQKHFRWSQSLAHALRKEMNRLTVIFLIPAFILITNRASDPSNVSGQIGRLMFLIAVGAFIVFLVRLLRPDTGIAWKMSYTESTKTLRSWGAMSLVAAIPACLMIAAIFGYMYSARTLMMQLVSTTVLLTSLVIFHELFSRWILIVNRRLLHTQAVEKFNHEQQLRLKETKEGEKVSEPVFEEPMIDLQSLDADTRKLVNTGLFVAGIIGMGAIWSSLFVALGFLREITLWSYIDGLPGAESLVSVSLADIFSAVILTALAYLAAKTIPSLLDVLLRIQGTVGQGARLAYSTLLRYAIVIIGVSVVSSSIGFQWSQIQWLVAALGVGIGFGLQDIVANFISGLIILVERPIRMGDVVTVGDVSGTVSKIQMRATTVTNWDRQELLVPNREFIAGRVLNWSLSDDVVRLVLKIGIAYGSDVRKAMEVILEVAQQDSRIIAEPEPFCTFDEFGDNALVVTLRAYVNSPRGRFKIISDLNLEINDALNAADIVVAFPQRDVHLDTSKPLELRLYKAEDPS